MENWCFRNGRGDGELVFLKQSVQWRTVVSETVSMMENRCFRNSRCNGEPLFQKKSVRWRTGVSDNVSMFSSQNLICCIAVDVTRLGFPPLCWDLCHFRWYNRKKLHNENMLQSFIDNDDVTMCAKYSRMGRSTKRNKNKDDEERYSWANQNQYRKFQNIQSKVALQWE